MELIDHTGHIYSLPSFKEYPVGYEYETFKHTLWLEDEYARQLSINEWYIRPVRIILHKDTGLLHDVIASIDSAVYRLISGKTIQDKIAETGTMIELDESDDIFVKELHLSDMIRIEDEDDIMLTFYVAGNAPTEATWTSNLLIEAAYNEGDAREWCPVTVGGVFHDECEELVINGRNMGVYFPKDILKAMYPCTSGTSVYSSEVNEALYNDKVKEYLMNYMRLHGECGNMDQVRSALKFFGWSGKVKLEQLVRTDNEVITQYVRDFLDTTNDIMWRMEHFRPSSLVSVTVMQNAETGEEEKPDFNDDFFGEMKPVMEDLFSKLVEKEYDNTGIKFYKPYYDWMWTETMLKLSCLKYYYQKYFLPMHVAVLSAAVQHQVHANDVKLVNKSFINITEETFLAEGNRSEQKITFPSSHILYAYTQKHWVDSNFNEFSNYETGGDDLKDTVVYYIDDICISLPIKFEGQDFYKCHLIIQRLNGAAMYESDFSFSQSVNEYKSLVIYPKLMNDWLTMNYWENKKYCLHLNVNDIWYEYEFEIRVPEMQLSFGKLRYHYNERLFRQLNEFARDDNGNLYIDFNSFMYLPSLVDVSNIRFPQEVVEYGHDGVTDRFVAQYREKPSIVSTGVLAKRYWNRVHYYKLLDVNGNEIRYTGNQDDTDAYRSEIIALYQKLFNEDGTQKLDLSRDGLTYDIYLMHDSKDLRDYNGIVELPIGQLWDPKWYIVLISRETIDNAVEDSGMRAPEINPIGYENTLIPQYVRSDNKWLINRMTYDSCHGINHFKNDDIIAGTVENIDFPFILADGTKWNIKPMSPGMQKDSEVESMTNTFLMSLGGDNTGYDRGYYNITVRYSLDGTVQNQRTHTCRICVKE